MKVYELMAVLERAEAGEEVMMTCTASPAELIHDPENVDAENGKITVDFLVEDVFDGGIIVIGRSR